MKSYLSLSSFVFVTGLAAAATTPEEITAPVDQIYIPAGFDDNDNVEVVVHGEFPNSCYTVGRASAKVDVDAGLITISATSYRNTEELCVQRITPFIQTVNVGQLPSGSYNVVFADDQAVQRSLDVATRTTESADDFLYATVEEASIEVNPETGKQVLQISGHFPHFFVGCMVLRDVQTQLAPSDVMTVKPIAEIVDDASCLEQPADRTFTATVGLKEAFTGEGLLHVRTLNGMSINRFIDIK